MTTARDIKKLVKPIREKYPEFALNGRLLFQTPIRHFLKGLIIERCRSKEAFSVLYVIESPFITAYGWNFGHRTLVYHGDLQWDLTIPNINLAVLDAFERKILPLINRITDMKKFEAFMHHKDGYCDFNEGCIEAVLTSMALGELDRSAELAEITIARLSAFDTKLSEIGRKMLDHTKQVQAMLLRGDKSEMAMHLHDLERRCIERIELTKFYEPTPFPLELM